MYSTGNTNLPTERNVAGGIGPQVGVHFTSALTFPAGVHITYFSSGGSVIDVWYMTFGTTQGDIDVDVAGLQAAPVDPVGNTFIAGYSHDNPTPGTYWARLFYKYGNNAYKFIDREYTLT